MLTLARRFVGLSLGVTIFFVVYILYWNRLLASLVCFCLRLATWDRHAPGSFWIEAGQFCRRFPDSQSHTFNRVNPYFIDFWAYYTTRCPILFGEPNHSSSEMLRHVEILAMEDS